MTYKLNPDRQTLGNELRSVFVDTLDELMSQNPRVIALEADLGSASGFSNLVKQHDKQLLNVGISEANMMGVASGLSLVGYQPFCHTFAPFATRRAFDQLFISGGYAQTTLNIFGSDPGFTVGPNGGTHTSWEDIALMRMIPNSIVCDPADGVQLAWLIKALAKEKGIHYIRANRKAVRQVYEVGATFEIGKGNILKQGHHLAIIAAGQLVSEALDTAEKLSDMGIDATVIDMFSIKPLDDSLITSLSKAHTHVVSIENHSVNNGLGSAIADVIAENGLNIKLLKIGVNERFGQVGSPDYLQNEFGLSADKILAKLLNFLA